MCGLDEVLECELILAALSFDGVLYRYGTVYLLTRAQHSIASGSDVLLCLPFNLSSLQHHHTLEQRLITSPNPHAKLLNSTHDHPATSFECVYW